jgi:hypothetical protein
MVPKIKMNYFEDHIIPTGAYLNDVRVDTERKFAYISNFTENIVFIAFTFLLN